jgi:hypothetical protein
VKGESAGARALEPPISGRNAGIRLIRARILYALARSWRVGVAHVEKSSQQGFHKLWVRS